mgnify:FL=1
MIVKGDDQPTLPARFAAQMGHLLGPDFPSDIGLAVSGGGDSMAMLGLCHGWAREFGVRLWVVTVDHGLRKASSEEAAMVAAECAALGHPHATLRWVWDGGGNVHDAARQGRLRLIDQWRGGMAHVLFAHTKDDVAETFLMRLARGSGVEGLSAMADRRWVTPHGAVGNAAPITDGGNTAQTSGFWVMRPLLHERRADLRHYAQTLRIPFVDDPSNDDLRFDRARARAALTHLVDLGLDHEVLAKTAHRLAQSRVALARRAADAVQMVVTEELLGDHATGHVLLHRDRLAQVERDTQLRLLAAVLQWVANAPYRPRIAALGALLDRVLAGGGGTLLGAQVMVTRDQIRVFREYAAVKNTQANVDAGAFWDGVWRFSGEDIAGYTVHALGRNGWRQIPEEQRQIMPHGAALSLPAVFDGDELIACAALGHGVGHNVSLCRAAPSFNAFLQMR